MTHSAPDKRLPKAVIWPLLIGAMALAAFLRLYHAGITPPGLHYDEAYYALDALRVLKEQVYPIFFDANNGREPLFIYLLAGVFRLFGPSQLAIRITAAIVGSLTIPALYLLVKEVFSTIDERFAQVAGLCSALVLATLYWHVHYSRIGLRAITMPLFEVIVLWLFWRALRLRRWNDFVWAGLALGLSMYTYLAARLLAPLLVLLIILVIIEARYFLRRHWLNIVLLFGISLLVSLPLWLYFIGQPDLFFYRLTQITLDNTVARGEPQQGFWTNIWKTIMMFTSAGDWGWADNLPGRPVFDPVGSVGFLLGIVTVLVHFRRTRYTQWLLCLIVMVTPTALTNYAPTYTRSLGAVIPCAVLAGLGFSQVWVWINRRLSDGPATLSLVGVLLCIAAYSGGSTFRDYFLLWAKQPEVAVSFDDEMARAAGAITELPAGSQVFVSFDESRSYHASLDFFMQQHQITYSQTAQEGYQLYWHNQNCLVIPPTANRTRAYLLPTEGESFLPLLESTYAGGETTVPVYDRDGLPIFTMFRVDAEDASVDSAPAPQLTLAYSLGSHITLLGANIVTTEVKPDDLLDVTLYWKANAAIDKSYTIFVQVIGETLNSAGGPVWGQRDEPPCQDTFPTTVWEPGMRIMTRHLVTISSEAPAGSYQLNAGMYYLPTGERLPVFDSAGQPVAEGSITLTQLQVEPQ